MIKTFTQDDLVRYIYQETTKEENIKIEKAMLFDEVLAEEYAALSSVVDSLKYSQKEPSQNLIDAILDYSNSYSVKPAELQTLVQK